MIFLRAIVRTPCKAMTSGITTANLGTPIYQKALDQHADYTQALVECGLDVTTLPADENFPDSCFVEDIALMTPKVAIITRPGPASRRGETEAIVPVAQRFYDRVEYITEGTVESGDIMMVGDHYYIGISGRTNAEGARQMIGLLEKHGMTGSTVALSDFLHLKTGMTYLEDNKMLAAPEFLSREEFAKYDIISVEADEVYAANSLWINGTVLTPAGYPKAKARIEKAGYKVREVDSSEF